jgi:hypothetical protein
MHNLDTLFRGKDEKEKDDFEGTNKIHRQRSAGSLILELRRVAE